MLAITHVPSSNLEHGQRTHIGRVPIDHGRAVQQHLAYCRMLSDCGARVETLDVSGDQPDCVFVEDTAIVLDEIAVLASMGTEARRAELAGIEPVLRKYRELHRIDAQAPLEGGDVLRVGRTLLVGVSSRTKPTGVSALEDLVRRHGYRVLPVPVRQCLHLKTACTALPDQRLLVNPAWLAEECLREFTLVRIPEEEPWAANTLPIGGRVCVAAGHVRTAELIQALGFEVCTVDLSEFAKAEGGITCASILINE